MKLYDYTKSVQMVKFEKAPNQHRQHINNNIKFQGHSDLILFRYDITTQIILMRRLEENLSII